MKKILVSIICFLTYIPCQTLAATDKSANLKIVYVSVNEAVEKTGEQKKIRNTLEKERRRIENIIRKKSDNFKKEATKMRKAMALLSESEKVKKAEVFQKMQMAMEQFVKEKEIEFQRKEAELRSGVINRIKQAANSIAKKEKVDVIRNRDGALWVHPKWDFTNKVVKLYKKKYK